MPEKTSTGLLLFVKAPQVGQVKTRLGKMIGLDHSCQLYRQFGLDLVLRLKSLNIPLLIFFAPDDQQPIIQDWLGPHQYFPQQGLSLGDRMENAFQTGFKLGFEQLIILGSDSPDVPLTVLNQGFEALKLNQVVIGPSDDGGYYTLGFSQTSWCPSVFHGIEWSTESVYSDTLDTLRSQTASIQELLPWYDVDTLEDLQRFYKRNSNQNNLPRSFQYLNDELSQYFEECD